MIFDPYTTRNRAFEPDMLNFYLGTEFEAHHPMGNVGSSSFRVEFDSDNPS